MFSIEIAEMVLCQHYPCIKRLYWILRPRMGGGSVCFFTDLSFGRWNPPWGIKSKQSHLTTAAALSRKPKSRPFLSFDVWYLIKMDLKDLGVSDNEGSMTASDNTEGDAGLDTNAILFCWLFTIKDQYKKVILRKWRVSFFLCSSGSNPWGEGPWWSPCQLKKPF